jgi:hypothetical protein
MLLVVYHPWWALGVTLTLLVLGLLLLGLVVGKVRSGWRRRRTRSRKPVTAGDRPPLA